MTRESGEDPAFSCMKREEPLSPRAVELFLIDRLHCLSKALVQVSGLPLESFPDHVLVRVFPSLETTLCTVVVTCPSFLLVTSSVLGSGCLTLTVLEPSGAP